MSDIREKVALAIANEDGWATTSSTIADYLPLADAALVACGHAEMAQALEKCITYIEQDKAAQPRLPGYVLGEIAVALAKARGET